MKLLWFKRLVLIDRGTRNQIFFALCWTITAIVKILDLNKISHLTVEYLPRMLTQRWSQNYYFIFTRGNFLKTVNFISTARITRILDTCPPWQSYNIFQIYFNTVLRKLYLPQNQKYNLNGHLQIKPNLLI